MKNADLPAMPIDYYDDFNNSKTAFGLTKREMFAMAAMQGILSNSGGVIQANSYNGSDWVNSSEHSLAEMATSCADALLAELERTK